MLVKIQLKLKFRKYKINVVNLFKTLVVHPYSYGFKNFVIFGTQAKI